MIFCFFFALSVSDDEEVLYGRPAKFHILSYDPATIHGKGGDILTLGLDSNLSSLVFCRFGDKVVSGKKLNDSAIQCTSPRIVEEEIRVSVSIDKYKWSKPIAITVIREPTDYRKLLLIATIVVSFLIYAIYNVFLGKKKRKIGKKKKRSIQDPLAEDSKAKKTTSHTRRRVKDSTLL